MDKPIKRIELRITPSKPGLSWKSFSDYIIDSFDTGIYEYSTSEGDDLRHVFYGRDDKPVKKWFHEQLVTASSAFPATLTVNITTLAIDEWKQLPDAWCLDPDFFDR